MRPIKFGMHIVNGDFERARRDTLLAEELGYYSVWGRIEELGCTWFKMIFPSTEFARVFAEKIMPEFV
jgi:hypothetical protein